MQNNIKLPDRFELIKHIATGGMADVFLCRQKGSEGFSKLVAIKKILPQYRDDDNFLKMFTHEAKIAAMLDHNNICKVYDFIRYADDYLLIMEYIKGITLRELIQRQQDKNKRIPENVSLGIVQSIAKALYYIHTIKDKNENPLELVHRDVTPSNVMVSEKGEIKLMDFGIAKIESLPTGTTNTGEIKGKIGYLSPEQIEGLIIDRRSDLFSLGIIFYELLASRRLFTGDSQYSILYKIKRAEIDPITDIIPGIDPFLEAIVMKCLAKERNDRYSDAKQLIADINKFALKSGYYFSEEDIAETVLKRNEKQPGLIDEGDLTADVDYGSVAEVFEKTSDGFSPDEFEEEFSKIEKNPRRVKFLFYSLMILLVIAVFYFLHIDAGLFYYINDLMTGITANERMDDPIEEVIPEISIYPVFFNIREGQSLELPAVFEEIDGTYFIDINQNIDDITVSLYGPGTEKFHYESRMSVQAGSIKSSPEGSIIYDIIDDTFIMNFDIDKMYLRTVIDSNPRGAEVIRDNEKLGVTPLSVLIKDRQEISYSIRKDGHKDQLIAVNRSDIEAGRLDTINLEKKPVFGKLLIRTDYNLNIRINRRDRGRISGERLFELEPGRYNIQLRGENVFYHFEQSIMITENETISIRTPGMGFVDITATPSRCSILINDIPLDEEPPIRNMRIAEGKYRIAVHWDQFNREVEDSFEIFSGERKTLPMFAAN